MSPIKKPTHSNRIARSAKMKGRKPFSDYWHDNYRIILEHFEEQDILFVHAVRKNEEGPLHA